MVRKSIGKHNLHVKVDEQKFRILQHYCNGGIERISASAILDTFFDIYITRFIEPRLKKGQKATYAALRTDIPVAASLVANKIEPGAFDE